MEPFFKTVALLVAIAGTAAASAVCTDTCYCPTGDSMLCMSLGITQPPSGYWPNITYASFLQNNISVVYKNTFTSFPNLNTLYLQTNQLSELDVETFTVMPKLEILDLLQNEITDIIPPSNGVVFNSLTILLLHYNRIAHLDPDLLATIAPKLRYLFLDSNPLQFSEGLPVFNHPTLVYLYMRNLPTPLVVGSSTFAGLPQMAELHLERCGVTTIDGAFASNRVLANLYISENSISQLLANTFAPTNTLRRLELDDNPLSRLEVSALSSSMIAKGTVLIDNTPLACACDYVGLYWWAVGKGVTLSADCDQSDADCQFARRGLAPHL